MIFQKSRESAETRAQNIKRLAAALQDADAVLIGAGAGLSTSAGFTYAGERFEKHFADFHARYGFSDMYSGGFYPYDSLEAFWAFWSRNIMVNRYMDAPKPVYADLFSLVRNKDYFVLTTNVDHCFQKAGFAKERLFYTQGDYGLFQCSAGTTPICKESTYDNEKAVRAMCAAQGFSADSGTLSPETAMEIPSDLVPRCPICHKPMTTNLRCDDTFVQDKGWYAACDRYDTFVDEHKDGKLLLLELGVGANTPGIIKYPFWQLTAQNKAATYACLNYGEAVAPQDIAARSICINADIGEVLTELKTLGAA